MQGLSQCVLLLVATLFLNSSVQGTGTGTPPHRHHSHIDRHKVPTSKEKGGQGMLEDRQIVQDKEHLKEDLAGELSQEQIDKMSDRELEYHYFRSHDYDKNFKLDGLELMAALSHVVHDGSDDYGLREKQVEEAEGIIDEIINQHDRNNDGYLSYGEYSQAMKA